MNNLKLPGICPKIAFCFVNFRLFEHFEKLYFKFMKN